MDIEKDKYEVSLDIEPKSVEKLKNIIASETEEISKRFNNGTETLDDLINNYRHLKIRFKLKNGTEQDLEVVELKYYLKLVEKVKVLLNELDKKDQIINAMANEIYITAIRDDGTHFNTEQEVIDFFIKKAEGK